MAITVGNVSVGTTAVALNATDTDGDIGFSILVRNPSTNTVTVYIGGSTVTADTAASTGGFPLAPGESVSLDGNRSDLAYGIVAATTSSVNVIRAGV